jgi:hypothetical protein
MLLTQEEAQVECAKTQRKETGAGKRYSVYFCHLSCTWHVGGEPPKKKRNRGKKRQKPFVKPPEVTHKPVMLDLLPQNIKKKLF